MAPAPQATPILGGRRVSQSHDLPETPNRIVQEAIVDNSLPVRNQPFIASSSPIQRYLRTRRQPQAGANPFARLAEIAEEPLEPANEAEEAIAKAQEQLDIRASILRAYSKAISQCTLQFTSSYGKKFATHLQKTLLRHWQNASDSQAFQTTLLTAAPTDAPESQGAASFATVAKNAASRRPGNEMLPRSKAKAASARKDKRVLIRLTAGPESAEQGLKIQFAIRDKLGIPLSDIPRIKQTNTGWALTTRTEDIQQRVIQEQQLWGPCVKIQAAEKETEWHSYLIKNFPTSITSWDGSTLPYEQTIERAIIDQTGLQPVQWRQSAKTKPSDATTTLIISFEQQLESKFRLLGLGELSFELTHRKTIQQCHNCWAFHTPHACRNAQRCGNCSSTEHQGDRCGNTAPRCANCHGPHKADYEHCYARPKTTTNGLRALSKTELNHARRQGNAECMRQNITSTETEATEATEATATEATPDLPMADAVTTPRRAVTVEISDDLEIEETATRETPSSEESTIFVAQNQVREVAQPLPLATARAVKAQTVRTQATKAQAIRYQAIKARYRKNLLPEPAEPSSEAVTGETARAARQRSPPSSPPLRAQSPPKKTKTQRTTASNSNGR